MPSIKSSKNVMSELAEVAEIASFDPNGPPDTVKARVRTISYKNKYVPKGKKTLLNPEQNYRFIPNNFKSKQGTAFVAAASKINLSAGLSGLFNMGNTCFFSTSNLFSIIMQQYNV